MARQVTDRTPTGRMATFRSEARVVAHREARVSAAEPTVPWAPAARPRPTPRGSMTRPAPVDRSPAAGLNLRAPAASPAAPVSAIHTRTHLGPTLPHAP